MKSIIDRLLNYTLECEEPFQKLAPTDEEYAAELALEKALNEEQKKLLNTFLSLSSDRHCDGEKEAYFLGFQAGAKIVLEIMGADFSFGFRDFRLMRSAIPQLGSRAVRPWAQLRCVDRLCDGGAVVKLASLGSLS